MNKKSLIEVDQVLIDAKSILFPDFWSQPNIVLKCFYLAIKKVAINISPKIAQILRYLVEVIYQNKEGTNCLIENNSICSIWLDSITLQGSLEKFMKSNCLIGGGFLDKAKAQCGSELSFTSIPEF